MLNAVLAALHLLNIREEFFFSLFYSECFCHLEDSGFCEYTECLSCTTKDTKDAATEIPHSLDTDCDSDTSYHCFYSGGSLWLLKGC